MKTRTKILIVIGVVLAVLIVFALAVGLNYKWFSPDPYRVDVESGRRYPSPPWTRWFQDDRTIVQSLTDYPVRGVDISKWQGYPVDFEIMRDRGATFVFIRGGYTAGGANYTDPYYLYNQDSAVDAGLYCGVYFYTDPERMSPETAGIYFSNLLTDSPCQLPPVLDGEDSGGLSSAALADWYKRFLNTVEIRTGEKPIIYTRSTYWNYYVAADSVWSEYRLWIARYVPDPVIPFPPYEPRDWDSWFFWQWTSSGDGLYWGALSKDLDLNVYNGTLENFLIEFELKETPEPESETIYIEPGCYFIEIENETISLTACDDNYLPVILGVTGE